MGVCDVLYCSAMNSEPGELLAIYESSIDDVYRYASRLTGGERARTDDLVQETYLGVLRRLQRGERLELTTGYLIVACRNRFLDELKSNRRREIREQRTIVDRRVTIDDSATEPALATEALQALPEDQRTAMILRYIDDLPVAQVARHLDRSVRATESLLVRGRTTLRSLLREGDLS
jgi:RNA polymerase sigma-70 factor (ECF subfamily)